MKAFQIVLLSAIIMHPSCDHNDTKRKLNQTDQQLEIAQQPCEDELKNAIMKMQVVELYKNVQTNLILCDNFEFTIRVDRLINNSIRYVCWKKPKSTIDVPDYIINNGVMLDHTSTDRKEYTFSNTDTTYSIEKIISKDLNHTVHIFLEIRTNKGKENYAWKMRDLSKLNVY